MVGSYGVRDNTLPRRDLMVPLGEDMTLLHWGRHGYSGIASSSSRAVQQPAVPLHLGRNGMKDPAGYDLTGLNTVTHLQYQTSTTRGFVQPSQNNSTSWGPDVQQQDHVRGHFTFKQERK